MASNMQGEVKHLVADSAAFLKNIPLHTIGERIYTISEVVGEIKDAATRQRLSVLPYEINFKQPSTEAIKTVTEFSKLTGDFKVLSAVDLKVMALVYQLEKEYCGTEHLKTKPTQQVQYSQGFSGNKIPGFYVEKHDENPSNCSNVDDDMEQESEQETADTNDDPVGEESGKTLEDEIDEIADLPGCSISDKRWQLSPANAPTAVISDADRYPLQYHCLEEASTAARQANAEEMDIPENNNAQDDIGEDEGFVEEDEEGWITPENIQRIRGELGAEGLDSAPAAVDVGCLTTDFAMQNVLIQMGLHVVSVDGMLIREAKSYVLKCYACFRVAHQLDKRFCPWCGNKTMTRVSMTIDENGVTHYTTPNRKRPFNIRGKKFSLPLPQGGRCSENPILVEDQPRGQRRLPPKRDKVDVFTPDFVARSSPFTANDVNSRAVQLGFHVKGNYWNRKNPNEAKKTGGRRKKR